MKYVLLLLPIILVGLSVFFAIRAVKRGTKTSKALTIQLVSFVAIFIIFFAAPIVAFAADGPTSKTTSSQTTTTTSESNGSLGWGYIAAALVTGLSGIGGGIAVAAAAPAAIAATAENPKSFIKSLIFVALGESIALYGLVVSVLIYAKL